MYPAQLVNTSRKLQHADMQHNRTAAGVVVGKGQLSTRNLV